MINYNYTTKVFFLFYRSECGHTTLRIVPEEITTRFPIVAIPKSRNFDSDQSGKGGRGFKKQKYPLDDYLINGNTEPKTKSSLLSPMSPVSSPETLDVLENAERLVRNAEKEIMEVNLNSALITLEENPTSYYDQRPLDDSLLYVREIVESKFQESNYPDKICGRKATSSRLSGSNRKLKHEKLPVKESTGIPYEQLEITEQNSEFSKNPIPNKYFLRKESDWFKTEPPKNLNVFPTSASNAPKLTKTNSRTTRQCAITSPGVIEINNRDRPRQGNFQVQTGPALDIRGGLTVRTIENIHISPDSSSVPLYNNVATYCFQYEPLTCARNTENARNEMHIQSTDSNDTEKVIRIGNTSGVAVIKDSSNVNREPNPDTEGARRVPIGRSDGIDNHDSNENMIRDELDSNAAENGASVVGNVLQSSNLRKSSIDDMKDNRAVSAECTQIRDNRNECIADATRFEFEALSDPERFKTALENLCKMSKKTRVSTADTDPKIFQGAIDAFVKTFFDSNSRSNSAHGLYSPVLNSEIEDSIPGRKDKSREKATVEMKNDSLTKAQKKVKLVLRQTQVEHHRETSTTVKSKINRPDINKLSTAVKTVEDLSPRQFRTGQRKESDEYSKPVVTETSQLPKSTLDHEEDAWSFNEEENSFEDLDLTQPCVSDVDEVLKTYRESISEICQGTEKLSQLITHHMMKNTSSALHRTSPPPILRYSSTENKKIPVKSTLSSMPSSFRKTSGKTFSSQRQPAAERDQRKSKMGEIPQCYEHPDRLKGDAELTDGNDSSANITGPSERTITLSNEKEQLDSKPFGEPDYRNNIKKFSARLKTHNQTLVNARPESLPTQDKIAKNQFMDVQYCGTEKSARVPILTGFASNKIENSPPQSSLRSPLCTYLNLDNACGKNVRLSRHSNYDIHSDQSADLDLYEMRLPIPGLRDIASNNDSDDKVVKNIVPQTKEIELQVFSQIIDAMKNSSEFMKWFVISLFNGIEIDSVNDVVKNLENAAVHPIIIEQFLVILRDRYKERSSLGGSLMTTSPLPAYDDSQKNHDKAADLKKINEDLDNLKKSIDSNNSWEIMNTHVNKKAENSVVMHPIGDQKDENGLDLAKLDVSSKLMLNEHNAPSMNRSNSQGDRILENELRSDVVQSEIISEENVREEELKNDEESLAVPRQDVGNRSNQFKSRLKSSSASLQTSGGSTKSGKKPEEDKQKAEETSVKTEIYQDDNKLNEKLKNSLLINITSKKNCSSSSTDKDISFVLPRDDEMNEKLVDSSNEQRRSSVDSKIETPGEMIGFPIESSYQNSIRINSLGQEIGTKMDSNVDSRRSSLAIGKNDEKLKIPDDLAVTNVNLGENFSGKDENIKCYCRQYEEAKIPGIESRNASHKSSLDPINALVNLKIRSNYNYRRLIDPNKKSVRSSPDRMTLIARSQINERSKPSKATPISKNHARKVADSSATGSSKEKKTFNKGSSRDKKALVESKKEVKKCANNTESSDSEKSDVETGCQLCIRLRGECNCPNCANSIKNSRARKEVPGKKLSGKEKIAKSTISPRQSNSPKRSRQKTGKYPSPREPRSTSLESTRNVPICGQGSPKINEKPICKRENKNSAFTKANTKPKLGAFSNNKNNNDAPVKNTTKLEKNEIPLNSASNSINLKMKDKSQNTAKSLTACKSTETDTGFKNLSWKELDTVEENKVGETPPIKLDRSENTCCGHTDDPEKRITKSTGTENFASMESQTSEMDLKKHEPNNALESIPEIEISAISEEMFQYPKIDEESIIVLQPLNEIENTFFMAKPNSAEKRIIREKLNRNLKIRENEVTSQNSSSLREFNQPAETASRDAKHSNNEIDERVASVDKATRKSSVHMNFATSTNNFVEKRICLVGCPGDIGEVENTVSKKQSNLVFTSLSRIGSDLSFLEEKAECTDCGINNAECSNLYSISPEESDYWQFPCRQDCQNEEICLILCAPKAQIEQSVQTNTIDMNEILERFIADNNVPNLKLPIVKAILQELNNFEDILRSKEQKLHTIPEKSESQDDQENTIMDNEREIIEEAESKYQAERTRKRSVQYEEPDEKLTHMMQNRKSLILPNVVRGIADMHPSTTLERLKLRSADPIVSGSFNKPQADKRYSIFNQADPASSAIDLNDPKVQEHLASVTQISVRHQGQLKQNNVQKTETKSAEKKPTPHKSNNKNSSKSSKSRQGMDADFGPKDRQNGGVIEHNNSMKSFESSDLEPGEFLEVRTPFDEPSKSYQSRKWSTIMEKNHLSKEKAQCHGFCNNNDNNPARKSRDTNASETTKTQCNIADGSHSMNELSACNLEPNENSKAGTSENISINLNSNSGNIPNSKDVKSITPRIMDSHSAITKNSVKALKVNDNFISKVAHDASERVNGNQNMEHLLKYSDPRQHNSTIKCSSRPQIIDYFLGKTKLSTMKVGCTNNKIDALLEDCTSQRDNCRQLYMKLDFTSKTTSELGNNDAFAESQDTPQANNNTVQLFIPRKYDDKILVNSDRTGAEHWEQTSSDTYSEGEINMPSSCSYSLGEVKVSTASITAGRSFEDPDGLTVFVTKSILDSTFVTSNSPGEILAELNKTEIDSSSSTS